MHRMSNNNLKPTLKEDVRSVLTLLFLVAIFFCTLHSFEHSPILESTITLNNNKTSEWKFGFYKVSFGTG